jgi:putative chitinase
VPELSPPGTATSTGGRGAIQATGGHNYTRMSEDLEVEFVSYPELASSPEYACETAFWYWNSRDGNAAADGGDIVAIAEMVNGGHHHLAERSACHRRALRVLAR